MYSIAEKTRFLTALLAGCISGAAFNCFWTQEPTLHIASFFLMISGLGILGCLSKHRLWTSYIFGIGFNTVSLYWIGESFRFVGLGFLSPFVSFVLSFIFSAQFPLSFYIGGRFWFVVYVMFDIVRSLHGLGFPWNMIGYTAIPFLSLARFVDVYGLSLLVLSLSQIWFFKRPLQIALIFLMLAIGWDHKLYIARQPVYTDCYVRLVQACIPQSLKWSKAHADEHFARYMMLSQKPAAQPLQALIWSEAALSYDIDRSPGIREALRKAIPQNGVLILGHPRVVDHCFFASLSVLDDQGHVRDYYDKNILVPFGEYVPFRLPLSKMSCGHFSYTPGAGSRVISAHPLPPFAPMICYETAFPFMLRQRIKAEWILSITNDAWFGASSGPYQHLHIARVRAIASGKPLVRVANNGISALISPYGQILHYLPQDQSDVLDVRLPRPL